MSFLVCFEYADDALEPGFLADGALVREAVTRLREQIQPPPTMLYVALGATADAVVDLFTAGGEEV
jgi:hypothetical protein